MALWNITYKRFIVKWSFPDKLNFQRGSGNTGIQMAILKISNQIFGVLLFDDKIYLGVLVYKSFKEHGKEGWHNRGDNAQDKFPANKPLFLIHDVLHPFGFIYDTFRLGHNLFPYFGDHDRFFPTV